jgi:hypothetical protein
MLKKLILSESEMDKRVAEFRKWIKEQPHMPQNIGKCFHNIVRCFSDVQEKIEF